MYLDGTVVEVEVKAVHILRDEELVVGEVLFGGVDGVAAEGVDQLHLLRLAPQGDGAQGVAAFVQQT
jgi:hypothetical protein